VTSADYIPEGLTEDLPVDCAIIRNLQKKRYTKPAGIQGRTIEAIPDGRNLIDLAHNGTGKTAAEWL
jgi:superfamily II DNA/RNA helicase